MSEFATLLAGIAQRPQMYYHPGGQSLRDFEIFLHGYSCGRGPGDECGQLADDFTHWVATYYQVHDGPRNGFRLILEHADMRDDQAFEEFFRLWPLYQRDRAEYGSAGISTRYLDAMEQLISKSHDA